MALLQVEFSVLESEDYQVVSGAVGSNVSAVCVCGSETVTKEYEIILNRIGTTNVTVNVSQSKNIWHSPLPFDILFAIAFDILFDVPFVCCTSKKTHQTTASVYIVSQTRKYII